MWWSFDPILYRSRLLGLGHGHLLRRIFRCGPSVHCKPAPDSTLQVPEATSVSVDTDQVFAENGSTVLRPRGRTLAVFSRKHAQAVPTVQGQDSAEAANAHATVIPILGVSCHQRTCWTQELGLFYVGRNSSLCSV